MEILGGGGLIQMEKEANVESLYATHLARNTLKGFPPSIARKSRNILLPRDQLIFYYV
jgi:hypothetical protein